MWRSNSIYFKNFIGAASSSFTLIFSLTTGIIKKLLSVTRNKKKKPLKKIFKKVNDIWMILNGKKSKINKIMSKR